MSKFHVRVNEQMTWPNPKSVKAQELCETINNMVYNTHIQTNLSREQIFQIRSIIEAYESLILHPARNLEDTRKLVRDIRKAINE